jgi:hypothetical protein
MRVFLLTRHHPAPWQLNTPTTPAHLFMFHILSKLEEETEEFSTC